MNGNQHMPFGILCSLVAWTVLDRTFSGLFGALLIGFLFSLVSDLDDDIVGRHRDPFFHSPLNPFALLTIPFFIVIVPAYEYLAPVCKSGCLPDWVFPMYNAFVGVPAYAFIGLGSHLFLDLFKLGSVKGATKALIEGERSIIGVKNDTAFLIVTSFVSIGFGVAILVLFLLPLTSYWWLAPILLPLVTYWVFVKVYKGNKQAVKREKTAKTKRDEQVKK